MLKHDDPVAQVLNPKSAESEVIGSVRIKRDQYK